MLRLGAPAKRPKGGEFDVVVIGAGPGGLTAAMYAARLGLKTVVLEKDNKPGGRTSLAPVVEDYPGIDKIGGEELAQRFLNQATKFGAQVVFGERVVDADFSKEEMKVVRTHKGREYKAPAVIIATGVSTKGLGVKGEKEYFGKGVSYCVVCDAPFFKGEPMALVGYDDHAMEEAVYMTSLASKVYIVTHGKKIEASESYMSVLRNNPKVEILEGAKVKEIVGDGQKVTGLVVELPDGTTKTLPVRAVFISYGEVPSTEIFKKAGVEVDERGFIKIDPYTRTNVPGVFAVGDVTGIGFQIVIAAGHGATAALEASKYVKRIKRKVAVKQ
ncbi:NAD(P)/FAD-dependent oxidoreductase [Ignicoccus hospitalis]|uniref:FAD-dependent pyridine nucleotide-disulphide oxidoreductase n=1 Tax=Ignicoccus hospitalis (strain KIN4/I / DSM 18386 / JCM 14125) TaxID=453591 RepID=A8AAY9_IGNH4|nr:FAD-dependent oxidoreductase [Ignicoccus hospitalis]ABU82091.1 FAD-dependent pyridine nucleotide-disulphide oxidoreductase [Ignicoccus hospitalis KIN4/I]HIH91049.1 FAD-dependent oxidoreductase [Desulfurococcaceae archaeon]